MTKNSPFTRRRLLGVTSGIAVLGLAGCIGTQTGNGDGDPAASDLTTEGDAHEDDHDDETTHEDDDHEDGDHEDGDHEDDDGHGHTETAGPTEHAEVSMLTSNDGFHFEAHVTRVHEGGTVTFVNESGSHSATAYHPGNDQPQLVPEDSDAWDSGLLTEEGATFEHTFETPGVYHYYCAPHETMGMIGSIIVGEPDAHDQPALEDPPAEKPASVREKIATLNEMCNDALGHEH
jgi:plastocyanin